MKTIKRAFWIEQKQSKQLKQEAKERILTESAVVREILDEKYRSPKNEN